MRVSLARKKRSRKIFGVEDEKKMEELSKKSSLETLDRTERSFVWRWRKNFANEGRYLLPFLKSVDWNNHKHRNEAEKLINNWKEPDFFIAFYLLGRKFEGNVFVRSYGVNILRKIDDNDLVDSILPLVECLLFEKQIILEDKIPLLLSFLIDRSLCSFKVCLLFEWAVLSKIDDETVNIFQKIYDEFQRELAKRNPIYFERLNHTKEFVSRLRILKKTQNNLRKKKQTRSRLFLISHLQKELASENWVDFLKTSNRNVNIRSPVNPELEIRNFVPEKSTIIKSRSFPFNLVFQDSEENEHSLMYYNDSFHPHDHFQDNMMTSLVSTCNRILKKNGMDLDLITYRVTSSVSDAFIEIVPDSTDLCKINLSRKLDLVSWLREKGGAENMEAIAGRFIRSCAGVSAITYLFGVGDRHLENIWLTEDGRLFHIDYAYILGRDPKRIPSYVRLSLDMLHLIKSVDDGYRKFVDCCCDAYVVLRRHSRLFEQVFVLMSENRNLEFSHHRQEEGGSGGNKHEKMFRFLKSKFKHGVSDEEARKNLEMIIEDEVKFQRNTSFFRFARTFRD